MPNLAIILCGSWALLLFVARSIIQWRKTGSTGFNGFSGRVGSPEWFAGACMAAGFLLTPMAPISTLVGWPVGDLFFQSVELHLFGAALAIIGIIGSLAAQYSMGDSWRIGVDPGESTTLVTNGIYAWVRNPIFSFIGLSLIGIALVVPNPLSLAAIVLTWLGIEMQVRYVEEPYLVASHGETYRRYTASVGRFIPGVGKGQLRTRATSVDSA